MNNRIHIFITFLAVLLTTFTSCNIHGPEKKTVLQPIGTNPDNGNGIAAAPVALAKNPSVMQYSFDTAAFETGCGRAVFQKASKDNRHELYVKLETPFIPQRKWIDITNDKENRISITYSLYAKDNPGISEICSCLAMSYENQKSPITYTAVSGSVYLSTQQDPKTFLDDATLRLENLVLKDSSGKLILLPKETFNHITIGWLAG